ncbi:MAG TPA: Mpo1-like protein, partial [Rudaea sp.]|nr:Mpo1-like protein [Rudaea sp.]
LRLSRSLGLAMFIAFVVLGLITEALYRSLGSFTLMWLAIGVFVVAWIAQFVGHKVEGKRPSFLTDLAYLLIGPAWIVAKVMRRLGIAV